MNFGRHLFLSETNLPPSTEWMDASPGWRMVRVTKGAAYWIGDGSARDLGEGEVIAIGPGSKGCLRASQLGEVKLHYFHFCPELLSGFLTLSERHYFQTAAAPASAAPRFLPMTHPAAQEFSALITPLPPGNNLLHRCKLMILVVSVFAEEMARHQPPSVKSAAAQKRFKQLVNEMPDSDLINHTPEQLAKLCGCSLRHFSRLFRQHFGVAIRSKQTELRLLKARQLLSDTDAKIIHVALESGYRHLGLFNSMFKKYLGMTPSEWRQKNLKKPRPHKISRVAGIIPAVFCLVASLGAAESPGRPTQFAAVNPAVATNAPTAKATTTNTPAASSTNVVTFPVEGYEITGNTIFRYEHLEPIFKKYVGPAITLDTIKEAATELQVAYHNYGFNTVKVGLPTQTITNGVVKVKVIEGRLAEINVINNRHFSSNNIMRALPSLQTNILLNSIVFQQDLDKANANRDRQIYANIDPGPEPGTSTLNLKVKDRLPLHARIELNNYSTPGTPEFRVNSAAQYNNLWQLEHQVGLQYSFTPEMKKEDQMPAFYDQPLVASYSAFYRMPLDFNKDKDRGLPAKISDFGYDEVAKRFRAPPAAEYADLIFYASRSFSDTGLNLQSESVTQPADFDAVGGLRIQDDILAQTQTKNEALGFRFSDPLPGFWGIHSSLSAGLDYKSFRSENLQREEFTATLSVSQGNSGPPFDVFPASAPPPTDRSTHNSVQYLPFALGWDLSKADKWGSTAFNLNSSVNFAGLFDSKADFQKTANSTKASGTFLILNSGLTRDQKFYDDWGVRLHADGQWASEPLISNEQFGIGGLAGVRGYRDGQEYGDTGWRTTIEPHTPLFNLGMVDATLPMYVRFSIFTDYGRRYLLDPTPGRKRELGLWGTGFGFNGVIGDRVDYRFNIAFPLLDTPGVTAGKPRLSFAVSVQF